MNIKRAKRDRWLMGVCAGIAYTYGWSPNMVRLATVILAIIIPGPSALLTLGAYIVLGIILPESDEF
ncbi:MAG TPA: PspC domain-containing protein [Rubrobacteraceae bacterium]|nr:PspC domain-containing protein [Rubrobacteraceae bacterium]